MICKICTIQEVKPLDRINFLTQYEVNNNVKYTTFIQNKMIFSTLYKQYKYYPFKTLISLYFFINNINLTLHKILLFTLS